VGVLEWLEAGVLGLRRLDDRLGGAAVRRRVEADLRLVCGLLDRRPQSRTAERRLLRIGADLAQLGGWAATDTGRHGAAQRHYLTGLRLAHSAGDRGLAVALWGGLSLQAVIAGRPHDAVDAAEAAVRAAGGTPPLVRALAAGRLARAHAAAGAEGAFRRAAAEAERRLDAAEADPGPPWLYWFDAAELAAQYGQSLLDLDEPYEAGPLLERALALQDPVYVRDRALYSARAARARALTGDLDGARTLSREAARLSRHCGSPRLAESLDRLKPLLDGAR
jgi:tetratricopeptide (TPR) repeat protein